MVNDPSFLDTETLGQFLQRQRTEQGVDLLEVAEETKIPLGTLQAMEGGDFAALPADAFARGFYVIYARHLGLDNVNILEQYARERGSSLKHQKKSVPTPSRLGKTVSPMAERPLITPLSALGFSLVLLVLITGGISWFFSWNPANFLSEELRSFGKVTAVQQKAETGLSPVSQMDAKEAPKPPSQAAVVSGQAPDASRAAVPNADPYTLRAEFLEPTKVTVTVDDVFPEELTFAAGQTHDWHAKKSIILALPSTTKTRLTLNGVVIPLPEPVNGYITVSIPGPLSQ